MIGVYLRKNYFYMLLVFTAGLTLYAYLIMPLLGQGRHASANNPEATSSKSQTTGSLQHSAASGTSHQNTASSGGTSSAPVIDLTAEPQVAIDIKNYAYSKQYIKIRKGTTVTWTNRDTVQHNVMKEHDASGSAHDAPKKSEVRPDVLASQLLSRGESYSFTFNETGVNPYHCSPHPYMKGSVTVVE